MSSIKKKSLISTIWVLTGFGGGQFIRLAANLVLTRLLAPELFGLMTVVNSIIIGVTLLSDIGIKDSLINNTDSHKDYFIRTAWTINLIRGAFIYSVVCLLAFPLESYFAYEGLGWLLIVCGSVTLIGGLISLNIYLVTKHLNFKQVVTNELISALVGAVSMIIVALITPTVWALAAGSIATVICKVILSYTLLSGCKMGFYLDRQTITRILGYGKWIFFSTATMYVASQGDKIILAKNISEVELGIYSIGAVFGYLLKEVSSKFSNELLFPLYRKAVEKEISLLSMVKTRWLVFSASFLAALVLSSLAEFLIYTLYDERYHGAAWILQFLAFAGVFHTLDDSLRHYITANKDSFRSFCVQGMKALVFLVFAIVLTPNYGILGIIIAMAVTPLLVYFYMMYVVWLYGYRWQYLDLLAIIIVIASFFFMWSLQSSDLWFRLNELASNLFTLGLFKASLNN